MDNISVIRWAGTGGLWVIFAIGLFRAHRRQRLHTPKGRWIWLLFFLWTVAFSLWGDAMELAVNQVFKGLPVGLYVKCVCMMLTFHGYAQILKPMRSSTIMIYRVLDLLTPTVLVIIVLSFVLYARNPSIPYANLRYLVIGIRDLVMGLLAVFVFIPYTLHLRRIETNPSLKLKQSTALVCFICFVMVALGGISAFALTLLQHPDVTALIRLLRPFVYIGFFAFLMTLVPYRWLAWFFHLPRWVIYRRLRNLEQIVIRHMDGQATPREPMYRLLRVDELELAIYRTVISILDQYPYMLSSTESLPLYHQIHQATRPDSDYPELVKTLTRLHLE